MFSHFFQFSCVHCKRSIYLGRNGLCSRCQKQIKTFPYCGRCGSPLQHYAMGCGHCLKNEPTWDRIVIIGHYLELPVPLYHFRQWQRGYNQADLLANWLSRWCDVPNCHHVVKRIKHTHTQRGLTAKDRRQNLKNAFAVNTKKSFPYERVALVDDVITTGSTLAEIAKQLRKLGVKEIQVWGLARA